ncbi:ArsR/SmtB family transcription factor [Desnuesiella massiliensis]|uniref:ArsR/SmtB family transcription factor n=1 Tax=Desnuesiella massiliensis TaxID=1650662 RepID=UPI0006E36B71|nr:metalloregulator ArsR/SmtB family transcription factor [Desnuesiella massiliensis]
MINDQEINRAVNIYKALGEPNRMNITKLLLSEDNLCCLEIEKKLESIAGSTLSHHLKLLTDCGILRIYKKGTYRYYEVNQELLEYYAPYVLK